MAIRDLFISYSSKDRPWAEKAYKDLLARYPQLKIFWDREGIGAGDEWRSELRSTLRNSKHLVVFWSHNAAASKEVGPEIEAFGAHRDLTPELEGSDRKFFYVELEGARGGGIDIYQGFKDFAKVYQPQSDDKGTAALAVPGEARDAWERMIRQIGDAVSRADTAQKVVAVIAATTVPFLPLLDQIRDKRGPGVHITLDQFLAGFGLKWEDVRKRYGSSAFDWHPAPNRTIVDLLEGVRVRVNSKLSASDRFRWEFVDLMTDEGIRRAEKLHYEPSVVVFDPVSLYDQYCANALRRLDTYVRQRHSVILSLSPALSSADDAYATWLRELAHPLFNEFLDPAIPPIANGFAAHCMPEVQREAQIDRLVRARIGAMHVAGAETVGKGTLAPQ